MREPPARVRFIGHPLVATPIMGLCGLAIFAWFQHPDIFVVGFGAIIGLVWTAKAQSTMNQYRRWHRAWDSMAEPKAASASSPMPRIVAGLIAVLVIGGFAAAQNGAASGSAAALVGILGLGGIMAAIVVAIRALLKRPRSGKAARSTTDRRDPVRVIVTRPILPVPDLKDAYAALPAHCWQAIDAARP